MRYPVIVSFVLALTAGVFAGEPVKPATAGEIAGWVKIIREHDIGMGEAYDGLTAAGAPALAALETAIKSEKNPKAQMMLERAAGVVRTRDVVKKMEAAVSQPGSIEYDLEATVEAGGQKIQAKSHGVFPNDGKRFRMEANTKLGNMTRRMLQVGTGEKVFREHSVLNAEGKPTSQHVSSIDLSLVLKLNQTPTNEVQREVTRVLKEHDIYAVEDAKLNGEDVLILKAVSQVGRDMSLKECKHFGSVTVRKSDYLPVRSEETSTQGSQDIRFSNIKLNGKFDPALFAYTPPKGVEVQDEGAELRRLIEPGNK